jgi:predicted alpha/beta-fold hydrolase
VNEVEQSKTLREFDISFTCKLLGIDVDEYYESSSCYKSLETITKPIMFVSSVDDPILKSKNIPFEVW